ncbi:chromo domain protein LHP1-like [Rutidosis leptorrhynchoides]|uniref:chromo domain protein LHP1-like n=1 Tax=Rutidosis leptorrhynchoides TaxID=125765 RepID=UPI003A9976AC
MNGASKRRLTRHSDLRQSDQNDTDDQVNYDNLNEDENEHDENAKIVAENERENDDKIVVPQLAEGYYIIEAVKRKRIHKGVTQYLIKWQGWPKSSNTWEPAENFDTCPEVIKAFEESLRTGGNKSKRKRKRNQKQPPPQHLQETSQNQQPNEDSDSEMRDPQEDSHSPDAASYPIPSVKLRVIEEPCQGPCVHGNNNINVAENNGGLTSQNGSAKRSNNAESFTGSLQIREEEENNTDFAIHIQNDITSERNSHENGVSNVDNGTQVLRSSPRIGSKRRKSFVVKRFKKDAALKKIPTGKTNAASDVIVPDENKNDLDSENVVDNPQRLPVIKQIVKPVNYSTSIVNGIEEVCVIFLVMRSDGEEVVVNNEYLKENNPLLLINFYEQHLRYNNPAE